MGGWPKTRAPAPDYSVQVNWLADGPVLEGDVLKRDEDGQDENSGRKEKISSSKRRKTRKGGDGRAYGLAGPANSRL